LDKLVDKYKMKLLHKFYYINYIFIFKHKYIIMKP